MQICNYNVIMRFLLTMNLPYDPAFGGANKGNRVIAEMLAQRGHSVQVVVPGSPGLMKSDRVSDKTDGNHCQATDNRLALRSNINGVDVQVVNTATTPLHKYLSSQLSICNPDCILVSSEDPMQLLLFESVKYNSSRVIYIGHSPNCFPLGPFAFNPSSRGVSLMKQVAAIISVSRFCANYILSSAGLESFQIYLPVYGSPPFPRYFNYDKGYITYINPCLYKGIDIVLDLVEAFPNLPFASVPTWGTTSNDRSRLLSFSNMTLLSPNPDIDAILRKTRVLLVPSLSLENFPMIIIEAMLRGIPVLASNVGGVPEAKLGTGYVLPVNKIERFTRAWDERELWIPIVPQQDTSHWRAALSEITSDPEIYRRESEMGRTASHNFASSLTLDPILKLISKLKIGD